CPPAYAEKGTRLIFLLGNQGTSMISKVKWKTEISCISFPLRRFVFSKFDHLVVQRRRTFKYS
ncbi:MAG: hypothetical protein DSY70_06370, partial [Desulfobulbus sp.]